MKNSSVSFFIAGLLLLGACAGPVTMSPQGSGIEIMQETQRQKDLAYKQLIRDQDRVFNVSFPVLAANTPFCDRAATAFGLTMWNVYSIPNEYRQAAINVYNLHAKLAAQFVADKSPAGRAGIRSGDLIVAINGQGIPPGPGARKTAYEYLDQAGDKKTDILFERNGQLINTVVQPAAICAYPVQLNYSSTELNAQSDGSRIVIDKGIVRFTENDNELALVIAHELGHNAMHHIDKQQSNAMLGGLGGLAIDALLASAGVNSGNEFGQMGQEIGGQAYSVAFEQEADYVGMYFMERAGYNSTGVADFWRRYAAESPKSVSKRTTHPTTPERFIAIDRAHREIAKKKATGQPLIPNIKQE
ncbi:MAG: M48 family metalloprotease [Alphaproteobacteria bacterium]|nr:M48 family metalloprotease [Alphaproteobacteria bacterium]